MLKFYSANTEVRELTPKKRTPSTESSPLLPYELTTPEEDAMLDEFLRNQPPDVVFIVQFLRKKIRMLEDALLDRDRRILELERQNAEMANTIADMALQIAELKARLDMHSRNSSKPPSSDGLKTPAPKSLRGKSGRKPGGQHGHPGTTLEQTSSPDVLVRHEPEQCSCGCSLETEEGTVVRRHQVFEIPEKPVIVTEHQVVRKCCPQCGREVEGSLPGEVKPIPVQYGPSFLTFALYLRFVQFIPYERLSQLCRTLFGVPFAKGTGELWEKLLYTNLEPFEETVRRLLVETGVLYVDETGLRVAGSLHWTHVAATEGATLLGVFKRRGKEGIDDLGVLLKYTGVLVHDCWKSYFDPLYACTHALCGAHLLRELRAAFENEAQGWAKEMFDLLSEMNRIKNATPDGVLSRSHRDFFRERYRAVLAAGEAEFPPPEPRKEGARGRRKKSKAANLHDRLCKHEDEVLLFIEKPEVPFTNNLAERALRMIRLLQKISGCARTLEGAQRFVRIRSFVDTVRKQGGDVFTLLREALLGRAWMPEHV